MAILKPLSCIRPEPGLAARIASGPHSAMSSEEIRRKIQDNPLSYTRIVHPKFLYEGMHGGDEPYLAAAENLERWIQDGIMIEDPEEAYYIFRMQYKGHEQYGMVGRVPVDSILNHTVKAHEKVRENKLADLAHHIELCRAQIGGPILMAYRFREEIRNWENKVCREKPVYDFLSEHDVWNTIWRVADKKNIEEVSRLFSDVESLYIADGHHRIMSAVKICQELRKKNPDYTGEEPWNYVTCVCFPDKELKIMPYSRIVSGFREETFDELMKQIAENFTVEKIGSPRFPEERGEFVLLHQQRYYDLKLKEGRRKAKVPDSLDVSVLQQQILEPLLNIRNDKRDGRLEFMGGEHQMEKVNARCVSGDTLGFLLYPTSMEEILEAADLGCVMPPKSTWFTPKMCNGLFIYRIFPAGQ